MKTAKNVIVGILLIALGVILGGNALGWFNIELLFDGWWTLFIIVPCFIGLFTDNDKKGSIIGLAVGILLLLACQNVMDFDIVWKLLLPIIVIVIGLSLVFKNSFNKEANEKINELNKKLNSDEGYTATFSGQEIKLDNEQFNGTTINAVFGGVKLDLRNAIMKKDVVINASAIFGGVDLIVPDNVIIKVKPTSIFGGVENKKNPVDKKGAITIYVNATCIFGGVDIK